MALGDGQIAVEAAQLSMSYAFGMPVQKVDVKEKSYD